MTYKLRDLETLAARVLLTGDYSVGRAEDADFVLDSESVSRHHAFVHNGENGVWVIDAGSTNGTRVGDIAATEWTPVQAGDIVIFGKLGFRLEHEIVGDPSLEGQLPPPAPTGALAVPREDPAPASPAPAATPGKTAATPNRPVVSNGNASHANGGGAWSTPAAPSILAPQKPKSVPRIKLPNEDPTEMTVALPQIKLEEAKREVDRLVERANQMAQNPNRDPGPATTEARAGSGKTAVKVQTDGIQLPHPPPPRPPVSASNPPPVRRDNSGEASKIKTDGIDALRVRNKTKTPAAPLLPRKASDQLTATPKSSPIRVAPRPAAVVEPPPPGPAEPPVKPKMSPAALPQAPAPAVVMALPQPAFDWRAAAFLFMGTTLGFVGGTAFAWFVLIK